MAIEADRLRRVSLFANLDDEELERVAGWFDETSFSEGCTLAGEGAPGYSFSVIDEGTAAVSSGGEELEQPESPRSSKRQWPNASSVHR